jgi:hypothetical protein
MIWPTLIRVPRRPVSGRVVLPLLMIGLILLFLRLISVTAIVLLLRRCSGGG